MSDPVEQIFNHFKTILCMCPNCDSIMRLSDLHVRSTGKALRTWLDEYESHQQKIEKKEIKFAEEVRDIRKKASERGRVQVLDLIRESIAKAHGNVAEAARELETDRANLYRRMRRLGISQHDTRVS